MPDRPVVRAVVVAYPDRVPVRLEAVTYPESFVNTDTVVGKLAKEPSPRRYWEADPAGDPNLASRADWRLVTSAIPMVSHAL